MPVPGIPFPLKSGLDRRYALADLRDEELRRIADLVADELRHVAGNAAGELTHVAATAAAELHSDSITWKWLAGIVLTIVIGLTGTAYTSLMKTDEGLQAQVELQKNLVQALNAQLAVVAANQIMVMQTLRDNGTKIDSILQKVYAK